MEQFVYDHIVRREKHPLVTEIVRDSTVAVDVRRQALQFADLRAFRFLGFGVELADLTVQQIGEGKRGMAGKSRCAGIEPSSSLGSLPALKRYHYQSLVILLTVH